MSISPYHMRLLILDYLCHSCCTRTANAFNKDSTIRHLDADGDEIIEPAALFPNYKRTGDGSQDFESVLKEVKLRQEIRTEILSGRVDNAIALLNANFPDVLSEISIAKSEGTESRPSPPNNMEYISSTSFEPAHLLLNLRILAFSEACRTAPLEYPPKPESSAMDTDSLIIAEPKETADDDEQQAALLTKAQKLYAFAKTLPNSVDRATYIEELENVCALLVYKVPEKSSMAKYLTLERREAVADQINRAILSHSLISSVELLTRYTHLLWQFSHKYQAKATPRPGMLLPPRTSKADSTSENENLVPLFNFSQFLEHKP